MRPNVSHRSSKRSRRGGFTLIEVLLVLAILVGLASVVAVSIFSTQDSAGRDNAKLQLKSIEQLITMYRLEMRTLPPDLNSLTNQPANIPPGAKWRPYSDSPIPPDPWGQPYIYQPGNDNRTFELLSMGPDGAQGTEDDIHYNGS